VLGFDRYQAIGSFCQGPSLLGLTLLPNPMIVGLGDQYTLIVAALAEA